MKGLLHKVMILSNIVEHIWAIRYISEYYNNNIQDGSVSATFTGTAYRVKYFKPIPEEIINIPQQFRRQEFFFISR